MTAIRLGRHEFTWLQVLTHLGALAPFVALAFDYLADNLSFNPIQDITFRTGKAALVLLVLSLACTPLNSMFGLRAAIKLRRPLGVYAFLYVVMHFLTFTVLDYVLDWDLIKEAILEKRFALVGFAAFLLLIPLFITSTKGWQKRLGKRWKALHKLVYLAAPLVTVHYLWSVKSDIRQPIAFGVVVALLLLARVPKVKAWLRALWARLTTRRRAAPSQPARNIVTQSSPSAEQP
jgi:sulfoxide reductase heme-binding subunit YedZ